MIAADTNDDINNATNSDRETNVAYNAYYHGVQALGGSFNFDVKYITRANKTDPAADNGVGAAITYNRDYYGFDGWSQTGIAYGYGAAANRGVNFGAWSGDNTFTDDSNSIFLTSYGVANVTDNLQIGTELVYWALDNKDDRQVWGQDDVQRLFVGVTPSYKINDNFRMEAVLTYANEMLDDGSAWGRDKDDTSFVTATLAPVFTVNADYWGRPQIKPYVTYMTSSDDDYAWAKDSKGDETRFGVEAEIWF